MKKAEKKEKICLTKLELIEIYGVSRGTFNHWVKPLNFPKHKKIYTPLEIESIFNLLGKPREE